MLDRTKKADIIILLILSCLWILMIVLVDPIGEFPLNDDWSYARAVNSFLVTGKIEITGWTTMTLIAQIIWGSFFCLPFGFSFTALRISTIFLGLIGIIAAYSILKASSTEKLFVIVGTLLVIVNPIYFVLSNTFMTDVPFISISMLSFHFYLNGLKNNKKSNILIATLLTVIAMLIRQLGIVIPISFGLAYLYINGFNKKNFLVSVLPSIIALIVLITYHFWLKSTNGLPTIYVQKTNSLLNLFVSVFNYKFIVDALKKGMIALVYIGLFLFPLLILIYQPFIKCLSQKEKVRHLAFSIAIFFIATLIMFLSNRFMPLGKNIIYDFGLGPVTLSDVLTYFLPHVQKAPHFIWLLISFCGIAGGIFLLNILYFSAKKIFMRINKGRNKSWIQIFPFIACVLYSIPMTIGFFDRFLLFYVIFLTVIAITNFNNNKLHITKSAKIFCWFVIVLYLIFSVTATHDYLAWNSSRWKALNYLTEEIKVSYKNIDGGLEFNGWYGYDSKYKRKKNKSWWWVIDDEYKVTFGPMLNHSEIKKYSYTSWLSLEQRYIYILKKEL